MEMISAIVHQLTRDLSMDQIEGTNFEPYYIDHTTGLWPQAASGAPFTSTYFQSKGDAITDLHEDMAAEQKARTTYDNIIRLVKDDPDILDPIRFLREREIVHYQRFGESLGIVQDHLNSKNFYYFNPEFDKKNAEVIGFFDTKDERARAAGPGSFISKLRKRCIDNFPDCG